MLAPDISVREHAQDQVRSPLLSFGLEPGGLEERQLSSEIFTGQYQDRQGPTQREKGGARMDRSDGVS